jgi:nucleoside-diphosphate-sugar epimerase
MKLFCFGMGYSATALVALLPDATIVATARSAEAARELAARGIEPVAFDGKTALPDNALDGATHILVSVPPGDDGDPAIQWCRDQLLTAASLCWVGYLSTTGVYGDHQGGWVDEATPLTPAGSRGARRVTAELQWQELFATRPEVAVQVFRLAGIYGPGRNQFRAIREGKARRLVKAGQVFSRIHVDDIATILKASVDNPMNGAAYNVCDDEPAPPQDVVAFAAQLLDVTPPPEVAFEDADLSPMARSFYGESKRVSNRRIRGELGVSLKYPNYRDGLLAVAKAEGLI